MKKMEHSRLYFKMDELYIIRRNIKLAYENEVGRDNVGEIADAGQGCIEWKFIPNSDANIFITNHENWRT